MRGMLKEATSDFRLVNETRSIDLAALRSSGSNVRGNSGRTARSINLEVRISLSEAAVSPKNKS